MDADFLASNKNAVHSKLLFIKKTNRQTVILLFGVLDAAGYRGDFSIVNIEDNRVKMPFDASNRGERGLDIEAPVELSALDESGRLCFVYTGLHEFDGFSTEAMKNKGIPDIGTYVPYLVYPVDDSCRLDKALSKKYMEKHYAFAGFEYSEKINILYPQDGGKPRIWKKKYYH